MEKFKACEKEMKTKAFSKEGLIASAKLDPKAQAKQEVTDWVQSQVEALLLQVEQSEAEIESMQGAGKKRGKANSGRLEELEHLNERRKWHISRLEIILRLLDNGSMPTEKVQDLKEDVNYFVESNTVRFLIATYPVAMFNNHNYRRKNSKRMREFTMNSTSTKKKRNSVSRLTMTTTVVNRKQPAKVSLTPQHHSIVGLRRWLDLPPRTPSKKHDKDEESVTSSKRDGSPVLKKAHTTVQLRKSSLAADSKYIESPLNFH